MSAASKSVLVFHAKGAESPDLERELRLVGIEVQSEGGTERQASDALLERGVSAVVFLDTARASIWVDSEDETLGEAEPVHIERHRGESPEMFALRSAELLRGKLLPAKGAPDASEGQKPSATNPSDRFFSLSLGPVLTFQTYAIVAPGITGDLAAWWGRFGVGPYFTMPLVKNSWTGTKGELTFRQSSFGLGGRFLPYQTHDRTFELQALLRVGVTRLALERNTGPQAQRFTAVANLLSVETGIEGSFAIKSWFRFGGQTVAGLDIPLNQPVPEGVKLPPPAKGKAGGSSLESVQYHLILSAIATLIF